jgi:hypothetical protein
MVATRKEVRDLIDILAPDLDELSRTRFVNQFTASVDAFSVNQVAEDDYSVQRSKSSSTKLLPSSTDPLLKS